MTNREYISKKLAGFNLTEAQWVDLAEAGIGPDDEYTGGKSFGVTMISFIEELVLLPRLSNISENGFSMSWNYADIGKYYYWLCKKYGVKPDADVLSLLGISSIIDVSEIW